MKKNIILILIICVSLFMSVSCFKKLEMYIEEAENLVLTGEKEEALSIYSKLLLDIENIDKLNMLGYDKKKNKAFNNIIISINKSIPDKTERLDFYKGFLDQVNIKDFYYDATDVLVYVINNDDYTDEIRGEFLSIYIEKLKKMPRFTKNYFILDAFIIEIYSSELEAGIKIKSIYDLFSDIDLKNYLIHLGDKKIKNNKVNTLNEIYNEILEKNMHTKIIKRYPGRLVNADSTIKIDDDEMEVFAKYEVFPDLEKYSIKKKNNYTIGTFIPLTLEKLEDKDDDVYYNVNNIYYLIPEKHRSKSYDKLDQIVFIKKLDFESGIYVDKNDKDRGTSFIKLIGIYVYDIKSKTIIDVQTFIGGNADEVIYTTNEKSFHVKYGESPINDVFDYLNGKKTESNIHDDLETVINIFDSL